MEKSISLRDLLDERIIAHSPLMSNLAHYDESFNAAIAQLVYAYPRQRIDTKITKCLKDMQKNALKIQKIIQQEPMQLFINACQCGIPSVMKEHWWINPEQPGFTLFIDERVPDFEMDDMNDPDKTREHDLESIFNYFCKKLDLCIKYRPKAKGEKGGRPPVSNLDFQEKEKKFLGFDLKVFFDDFVNSITDDAIKEQVKSTQNFICFAYNVCIKIQKVHGISLGMSKDFPEKDEKRIRNALLAMNQKEKSTPHNHRIYWNQNTKKFEQTFH